MPKKIDKKEKKAKILEASIRIFAKKGVNKTKISDIAEAADIGKGTIYEYFRSKDEIFAASFYYFMEKVDDIISKRLFRIYDPLEKLKTYFSAWAEIIESNYRDYLEIVVDFWAEGIRTKHIPPTMDLAKFYDEYRRMIENMLEECISKNKIKPVNTRIVASIMLGSLDGLLIQGIVDHSVFNIREAIEILTKVIIDGLKK
jgi:AcrR family transcriptional regulator